MATDNGGRVSVARMLLFSLARHPLPLDYFRQALHPCPSPGLIELFDKADYGTESHPAPRGGPRGGACATAITLAR